MRSATSHLATLGKIWKKSMGRALSFQHRTSDDEQDICIRTTTATSYVSMFGKTSRLTLGSRKLFSSILSTCLTLSIATCDKTDPIILQLQTQVQQQRQEIDRLRTNSRDQNRQIQSIDEQLAEQKAAQERANDGSERLCRQQNGGIEVVLPCAKL